MTLVVLLLFTTLVISFPVAFAFGLAGLLGIKTMGLDSSLVTSVAFQTIDSFPLMAIPFFILAGDLMKEGGLSERLIGFIHSFVGHIKGSLGAITVLACLFFGAISGSAVATVAAIGSVMIPIMERFGYNRSYTAALTASAGFLGILIPPSIPLVVYGVTVNVSIGELFLSTVIPGILLGMAYMAVNYFSFGKYMEYVDKSRLPSSFKWEENRWRSTLNALPALFMPVIILGGIYGGVFTPTEAAAVSCVYAFAVGIFVYRGLNRKNINGVVISSALTSAVILIIVAYVGVLGRSLAMVNIPQILSDYIISVFPDRYVFLLVINIFFLIVGMFMETNTSILLFSPLLYPAVLKMGIDPVHFGAILVLNLGIGTSTPPFATNLFVASKVSGVSIYNILKPLWPFLFLAAIPILFIVTYLPVLTTWLPGVILR